MGVKDRVTGELDKPLEFSDSWTSWSKKGKLKIVIFYEDGNYSEFYRKNKEDYTLTIKKRKYFIIPKCIVKGKNSTLFYYINNPMPIEFSFEKSKVTAEAMYSKEQVADMDKDLKSSLGKTILDASTVHSAMTSNLVNKMFANVGMTTKGILLIAGISVLVLTAVLHFTGVIDVGSIISGGGG